MSEPIEFFFDFRSPYSYLAHTQLGGLGVGVTLRPFDVLKAMKLVDNVPTTIISQAKGNYAGVDLGRWAKRYGVGFAPSPSTPKNSGDLCSQAVLAAGSPQAAGAVTAAVFDAFWAQGRSLRSTTEVIDAISAAGADTAEIATRIEDPSVAALLDANTREAGERGVFGAPTIFVGAEMFFGNDRLEFVRECLTAKVAA
ncbi:MAG TPA: 2-hydroxychromene-2-carboxylate isomerase [Caulobacter sp.]|nr:2-hydroxychromene-2-carboxylate isomerase [Caulobacter sp.]